MALASITLTQLAWLLIAMGVFVLVWAAYDFAMGETSVEAPMQWWLGRVQQDHEPTRFRRLIVVNLIGGVICLAIGGWLLIAA